MKDRKNKNEHIKEIMGVKEKPDIIDIIERKRLQWHGHVKRMQEERLPKLMHFRNFVLHSRIQVKQEVAMRYMLYKGNNIYK